MAATIMESIIYLVSQLTSSPATTPDGQIISLRKGDDFHWDPNRLCIFYNLSDQHAARLLLHELGHATLGHSTYSRDIELIALERAAWDKALALASNYGVAISPDVVEDHLDTYRDWLHSRSLCPKCMFTGLQTGRTSYSCPACHSAWRVNQARTCGLRRYITK